MEDDGDVDDLPALLQRLGDPRRWTFVIDFDGTLAPIVDVPSEAAAAPGALDAIADLARVCEVAILSGRGLDDLVARLGRIPADVLLVGGHGSEARRPDGSHVALADLDAAATILTDLEVTLRSIVDEDAGWWVERKSTSLVVHHRRVADADVVTTLPEVRQVLETATDRGPGFVVTDGKAIVELKARGVDKGVALSWLVAQAADRADALPGAPAIAPVVFGDDTTDEDAFAVALELGGEAVIVADEPATGRARFRLRDPSRVVTLLRAVGQQLGATASTGVPHRAWSG